MTGEALREALAVERRLWPALLARWQSEGSVHAADEFVWLSAHVVRFTAAQEQKAAAFLAGLRHAPATPSGAAEPGSIDPEVLAALLSRGEIERLAQGVLLDMRAFTEMRDWALETIDREGQVTVAALRDHFSTSRKIALALLEHLDDLRLTRRLGDIRVRGASAVCATSARRDAPAEQ
jgi:selenocysteine-specific elongation factor